MDWSFLATPLGIVGLIAVLLAGGAAGPGLKQGFQGAAEFLRARFSNGGKKNGLVHDTTAELKKDLEALTHDACATEGDLAVAKADIKRIDRLVTQPGGMQERLAVVEADVKTVKTDVAALPGKIDAQLKAQTLEIRTHLSQEVFRAVRGLHDELAEETDKKIAEAKLGVNAG